MRFHKDNFLHLNGVITRLNASEFFEKCVKETIVIDDFICDSSNELKGKVKEKLKNLSSIDSFFDKELIFQETFEKNRVRCKIATSDGKWTLGFVNINKSIYVPLTLLNKNQIKMEDQIIDILISKKAQNK